MGGMWNDGRVGGSCDGAAKGERKGGDSMERSVTRANANGLSLASHWSLGSALCIGGLLSFASIVSLGSAGSLLSVGSVGSVLSIGAAGGVLRMGGRRRHTANG